MRNAGSFVSLAAVVLVFFAAPRSSMGDVVLYDDFDDENWDGWSVYNPYGEPGDTLTPVLVPSPEGWAVRGVGSGYGSPEAAYLVHPLALSGVVELSIEMRARSGSSHPTHSTIALFSGADYNAGYDYGEFSLARFQVRYDGIESVLLDYSLSAAHDWHDFKWSRDGQGWWSLSIDGSVVAPNFVQDTTLTSFDAVALTVVRQESEIEWIRVSVPEPTSVEIDIKPGSHPNNINLGSHGVVPVAILSSATFDATQVDAETVFLSGAGVAVRGRGSNLLAHEQDVDGDGLLDLVVQVETENLDPDQFQDGFAVLTGTTFDGEEFLGLDEITIVP